MSEGRAFGVGLAAEGKTIRLVIADSHQLFRECLATALAASGGIDVIAEVESCEEALGKLPAGAADVLLLGLDGDGNGDPDPATVLGRFPQLKLLLLGRDDPEELALRYLEAGAKGYLLRDQSLRELQAAIEAVARGETACSPRLARSLFSRLGELGRARRRRDQLELYQLTAREMEILCLIADGLSNHEIAQRLFLSVHTVKNHVHKILDTLGVPSRWAAVTYALQKGWIRDRRHLS
ncbi:MAG TPA: response regulator transcription factor [Thermoanaerobaculia bacterium]